MGTTNSDLYYKPMMIVNDDSRVINKPEASLTDDARVIIYNHHMFKVQATGWFTTIKLWTVFYFGHFVKSVTSSNLINRDSFIFRPFLFLPSVPEMLMFIWHTWEAKKNFFLKEKLGFTHNFLWERGKTTPTLFICTLFVGAICKWNSMFFAFSLIIEGATEKVRQLKMPLKSIYN
jgi:hypothetical protein